MMRRELTLEEHKAITALNRLGKRWPKSLKLFSWSGTLVIFDVDDDLSNPNATVLADIWGFPNDGGDP